MKRPAALTASLALCLFASTLHAADWPFFRGPNRDGKSTETNVPLEWSKDKNVRWRTPLPSPGNSSPIVTGDRVFLTCARRRKDSKSK